VETGFCEKIMLHQKVRTQSLQSEVIAFSPYERAIAVSLDQRGHRDCAEVSG